MALGPQFHKFTNTDYGRDSTWEHHGLITEYTRGNTIDTTYEYRPKENEQAAFLDVIHQGGSTSTTRPVEYDHRWLNHTGTKEGEQIPLFVHDELRPYSMVKDIRSTEGARVPAMKMLAIADIDAETENNTKLISSGSLSPHSQRLVQHLADLGATTVPDFKPNHLTYLSNNMPVRPAAPETVIPEETVKAGSKRLREVIRKGKAVKKPKEQPPATQLQLPGMD